MQEQKRFGDQPQMGALSALAGKILSGTITPDEQEAYNALPPQERTIVQQMLQLQQM
jgi:hypothetical protein